MNKPEHTNQRTFCLFITGNIVWALVIFLLCALPGEDLPDPHLNIPHLDKIVHFGMFFIMSLLLIYLLIYRTSLSVKIIYALAILLVFIYGGTIEILQYHFFNRSGELWDLLADFGGGIAGCLCYPLSRRILSRLHS